MSDSLTAYGLKPARLLCPWVSPGKNTGVGCHALLQGIFLTEGLNLHFLCLLHWHVGSSPRATWKALKLHVGEKYSPYDSQDTEAT